MSNSVNVNNMKLADFANMVRMSAEGNFKTSADKTSGVIYADQSGKVHNVRHYTFSTGDAANNLQLRQKLAGALESAHASRAFLADVRAQLGLTADGQRRNEVADKPLSRREIKMLLSTLNEGVRTIKQANGGSTVQRTTDLTSTTITEGLGNEWVEIDTLDTLRQKAKHLLEQQGGNSSKPLHDNLSKKILYANSEELRRIISGLAKGNPDPIPPFGEGVRETDFPKSVAQDFADTIRDSLKQPAPSDNSVLTIIKADINREWVVSFNGVNLPRAKDVENQDDEIKFIVNGFFKGEEAGIKNQMMSMINQSIYTPLSTRPLLSGSLPGGVIEDACNDIDKIEKKIDVSRSGTGDIRVSVRTRTEGFSFVSDNKCGSTFLDDRQSNFRETTVVFDVYRNEKGEWDVKFVQEPHVSYNFGRELKQDEVEKRMISKVDDLLKDKTSLTNKMVQCLDKERSKIEEKLANNRMELEGRKKEDPTSDRCGTLADEIAANQTKLKKMKSLAIDAMINFSQLSTTREKLLKNLAQDGFLSKSRLGRWDEDLTITMLYDLYVSQP